MAHPQLRFAEKTARRDKGFGLVEIMVGVTIGLLALLIVYQVLSLSEGYRRTTTAGGDAQSAGMISTFVVAQEVSNAGHTIADAGGELDSCPNTGNFATTWRPIPVLITDGGSDDASDSFAVMAGTNRRLVTPLDITTNYVPGGNITVQSPLGFHPSRAGEGAHRFILVDIDPARAMAATNCDVGVVSPWPPNYDAATGIASFAPATAFANGYPQGSSWLVNLGPADRFRKINYDVAAGVLRSTDLTAVAAVPNPIVSNVVLMKAQYGIDTDADTFIDTWTSARNAPWRPADVLGAPLAQLRQIKAIRIAVVVRSSQFERAKDAEGRDAVTDLTGSFTTTLFPCHGLAGCTGEIAGVVIPGTANFRRRVFEQVIPLTNQIWNAS
jgi:type IV pilus assembly protein PilW